MGRLQFVDEARVSLIDKDNEEEDEALDRVGGRCGVRHRLPNLRPEGRRQQDRQRTSRRPWRIPLANLTQILSLRLFPKTTHLRRYFDRPWLGSLRRSLLRKLQVALQIP